MTRIKPSGPLDAKLVIVGEAPGAEEEKLGIPFVGTSGQDLRQMLREAGINPSQVYYTNVFLDRPPDNKLEHFLCPVTEARAILPGYDYPKLRQKYVHPDKLFELDRLKAELESIQPNLILALGDTATWALTRAGGFMSIRGTVVECSLVPSLKVLPTRHVAAMYRDRSVYPIIVADLEKAAFEMSFPDIRRPKREVHIPESLRDCQTFYGRYILADPFPLVSIDAEWSHKLITVVSFAPRDDKCLTVPFIHRGSDNFLYWQPSELLGVLRFCFDILQRKEIPKLFQNGVSDMQAFWRLWGCPTYGAAHDTMLIHHALQTESRKSLEFLASVYCNEAPWKLMRGRDKTHKREE